MTPTLTSDISGTEWRSGPQTPAQKFMTEYANTVDSNGFNDGSGLRFYSPNMIFHNQNNATYRGGEQMWSWMKELFAPFERLRHDVDHLTEIALNDGTKEVRLELRGIRNIWMKGNTNNEPDVSIPLSWICRIGPADSPEGFNGLQFKENWIYWDTALLAPFLKKDAVAFRRSNPYDAASV